MLNKFNNLSLNVKFLISCLWMLIPLLIVLSFLVRENFKTVNIIKQENVGNHIVHHLYPDILAIEETKMGKSNVIAPRLEANKNKTNNNEQPQHDMTDMDMTGMEMEEAQHAQMIEKALSDVEKEIKALENASDQPVGIALKSAKIPELSAKIYALVDEVERAKSNSGLTADREPETYYLTYMSAYAIPKYLKQIADFNTFLSINRNVSAQAAISSANLIVSAQAAISSANLILLDKAFEEFEKTSENLIKSIDSPEHKKIIEELSQKYVKEKRILFQAISDSIAKGEKYSGKINYEPTLVQSIDYTSAVAQLLDENLKRIMRRTWIRLGYELLVTIFAVAIGLVLVRLLLSSVAQPLTKSTHVMEELSEGIVPDVLPELNQADFNRKDEIGKLTKALKSFHEVLLERKSLLDARELEKAIANRAKRVEMLNREFENESRNSLAILAESSNQLNVTAKSMVGSANNTNENAASVATATQQVGDFIEVVSTSSHELVRSLDQIGTQVETSQDTIRAAVSEAKESITQINNLNNAADKIGDIVGLINSIASQTNLLALNATIEAARAGDAGRGFAVVANEVKSLAAQTANATEEISAQIGAMQAATTDTVQTIERIASTINRIDALAGTIRESLQRERAMTENMANLVKQAENGADQVTSNLSQFTKAADTTSSAAEQVLGASEAMRDQARLLNARIDTYLQAVATA